MNVTFHTLGSFATAAVLSNSLKTDTWNLPNLFISFVIGILIHGILDFSPHQYPFSAKLDIALALFLLALMLFSAKKQNWLLILVCFGGAIFPDVIDLGGEIANKHLGIPVPHLSFNLFPWHWKEFSGSIYNGSKQFESNIYHIVVILICLILLYFYRKQFFRYWKINEIH